MRNKIKKFLKNKWVKWGLVPVLLFSLGSILTLNYIFETENSFLVLVQYHDSSQYTSFQKQELLKGQKVSARFSALDDYLGIVAVRFTTFTRDNDDFLIFRLKQSGMSNWYYQANYKVDQFQPDQLFTFGFPPIIESKGKNYEFEIESTKGVPGNAIALNTTYPAFVSKYKFPKDKLFVGNSSLSYPLKKLTSLFNGELLDFLNKKFINTYNKSEFVIITFYYFLPFIIYLAWNGLLMKYYRKYLSLSLSILVFMALETNLVKKSDDLITVILISIWIFICNFYKLNGKISYLAAIVFLIPSTVLGIANQQSQAERFAVWTFLLFGWGLVSELLSNKMDSKQMSIEKFISTIMKELKFHPKI